MHHRMLLFLALFAPTPAHAQGIEWVKDLATAHEAAAREGKPVIAYFTYDT